MPSSLTTLLPMALGFSPHLPVSVCGTGASIIHTAFLATEHRRLFLKRVLSAGSTNARVPLPQHVSVLKSSAATDSLPYVHRLRLPASP